VPTSAGLSAPVSLATVTEGAAGGNPPGDGFDPATFAQAFQRFLDEIHRLAGDQPSPIRDLLERHLGRNPGELPAVADRLEPAEHPNLQLVLDELERAGWDVVGLPLELRHYPGFSLAALARRRWHGDAGPGPVEYVDVPVGPGETLPCAQLALYTGAWEGRPLALLAVAGDERMHEPGLTIEVVAAERATALAFLRHIRSRRAALDVYRGKTVSFTFSPYGRVGLGFVDVPPLDRTQIVLPEADLAAIEQHTVGIADSAAALRAAQRHIKRGLLLYGPPGTGKTLSVMYLCSRMPDRTTVVLSGPGTHGLGQAMALARSLQPSMVVLEDVDLVAQERTMPDMGTGTHTLLFQLLNEMDGLAEDADVIFVLTTNRVELLEPALAARPGRIDQAVELKVPDVHCRRRLFDLYLRDVPSAGIDTEPLVVATEGVSAAFIRELVRRAVLGAALASTDGGAPTVEAIHLQHALTELQESSTPLLRTLLGASASAARPG
jgi:ATPase family associated with various cellular activities (AAA)